MKDWAIILAAVALALAGWALWSSGHSLQQAADPFGSTLGVKVEEVSVLPEQIEGFELQETLPRVDPIFPGELYSTLVAFVPLVGAPFENDVGRVGVMLYRFDSPEAVPPTLDILSLGNPMTPFRFRGMPMLKYLDLDQGQFTILWGVGPSLVQVLTVMPPGVDVAQIGDLESAALQVLDALIAVQPSSED